MYEIYECKHHGYRVSRAGHVLATWCNCGDNCAREFGEPVRLLGTLMNGWLAQAVVKELGGPIVDMHRTPGGNRFAWSV